MRQSVKDGVAQRGVADDLLPLLDGQLAADQGGPEVVAVLQDFEDIATLLLGQADQPPVVDDEQVEPDVGGEDSAVPAVRFGQGEVVRQLWWKRFPQRSGPARIGRPSSTEMNGRAEPSYPAALSRIHKVAAPEICNLTELKV